MKRAKTAGDGVDANSVLKKHLSAAQKRKRKRIVTIIIVAVLVVTAITVTVIMLRDSVTEKYASSDSSVESATVALGSIKTTVSGSGTLADDDVEDVDIPASVEVNTVAVEEGDTVNEGDVVATVDTASVISAMADLQDQIDDIDAELEDVSDDTVSSKVTAGIAGRVKKIYAQAGDDVATVMYEDGALALISLDGLMAVDFETTTAASVGDTVSVTLSDGSTLEGTVQSVKDGTMTVTVTDDGTTMEDTVTVANAGGTVLGTGKLYINSELKVTGYAGTISKVYVAENKKVSSSTKLFYLTDTSYTANYDTLLKERASLEEDLDELIKLYKQGAVYAPISGTIYSVDYDEDSEDQTPTDSETATAASETAESVTTSSDDDTLLIATVCPNATMSVTVDMDESDILSLEEGQEATVTVDSIGDDEFTGTVTEINKTGTSSNGVTVFTVEVTIEKTDKMLAGMSASVDITVESVDNVLTIPSDALQQTSNTSYVYTEYDEETKELGGVVEVTTGLNNDSNVEIQSGLSEGDTVYYNATEDESESNFGNWGGMPQGGESGSFPGGQQGGMPGGMPGGQ
jgi:multidrug efflux pump subunit AcrA (membrane-fusion protein)